MCAMPLFSTAGARKEFQYCDYRSVGAASDDLLGDLLHRLQESKGMNRERRHLVRMSWLT